MDMHKNCLELVIVLSGAANVKIEGQTHIIDKDNVIFYDGMLEHTLNLTEDSELIIVHIPKDLHDVGTLLKRFHDQ